MRDADMQICLVTKTTEVFLEVCEVLLKTSIHVSVCQLWLTLKWCCPCEGLRLKPQSSSHILLFTEASKSLSSKRGNINSAGMQYNISTSHTWPELSPLPVTNWKQNFLAMFSLRWYLIYTSNVGPSILDRTQLAALLIIYWNNILSVAWAPV